MSAISSTLGSSIAQYIQSLTQNSTQNSTGTSNSSTGSTTAPTGHRHHGGGGFAKLADAIASALQSASNSSSGSTATDANQTITDALTKIFKNGSLGSTSDSDDAQSPTGTDSTSTTTDGGLPASFVQTLKSFGVTAQQFQTDLSTALQSAQQSGNFDPSSVLKNFPAGSLIDALG